MVSFCAATRRDSFSLLRLPFLSLVQDFRMRFRLLTVWNVHWFVLLPIFISWLFLFCWCLCCLYCFCPKVNVIVPLEYELAYCDFAVNRFNPYTTKTPPPEFIDFRSTIQYIVKIERNIVKSFAVQKNEKYGIIFFKPEKERKDSKNIYFDCTKSVMEDS